MSFQRLKELRDSLLSKADKTQEEVELLKELQSLGDIFDNRKRSLSAPSSVCSACGRPFTE